MGSDSSRHRRQFSIIAAVLGTAFPVTALLYAGLGTAKSGTTQRLVSGTARPASPNQVAELLRQLSCASLEGAIYFRYTTQHIGDSPDRRVVQYGVLYVGPQGRLRLDLSAGAQRPIVCAVTGQTAWMIWQDAPLVYTSALPIKGEAAGWRGQLRAQVGQTLYWADVLLARMVSRIPPRQVLRIERLQQALRVDLSASAGGFFAAPLSVRLVPADHRWRIADVETGGATLEYDAAMRLADRVTVPSRVTMLRNTSDSARMNVWEVVDVLPLDDADAGDVFAVPSPTSGWVARLAGEVYFDPAGREHLTLWK